MDISKKTFVLAVIGLILLRILLVVFLFNNVPFTDMQSNWRPNFTASYQPDEYVFFIFGKSFADFKPAKSIIYMGYAMFLAPFIYFTGATDPLMIAKPIAIAQGIVLFALAIILIVFLGQYFFKNRKMSLISAALFVIYPYLMYGLWSLIGHTNAIPTFHYQMWIFTMSDYLSAFLVILAFWLFIKFIDRLGDGGRSLWWRAIAAGAVASAAALVRPPNLIILVLFFVYIMYLRRYKSAIVLGLSGFVAYLPQLIYNTYFFKRPWIYGNIVLGSGLPQGGSFLGHWNNPANFWLNFKHFSPNHYFLLFLIAASVMLFVFIFGLRYLSKTNNSRAAIFSSWFLFYWLFYGQFSGSMSQLRYFLPAVPVFIYFFVGSVLYLYGKLRSKDI
ncbi:hypothetical protein A3A18_01155 [Candidatus Azambacteria bacterium RIFCSPLOWO2_01_FULL_44_84]|uniref:Glycosyltransferase RgtA/B/C/D-like domain-containing protein n=1 Tax=Candidatus Azambacteria bacterium RIFCSPLOWO2_02_FULL_44_14 TaxID=1797306 RepID=A0A1F5CCA0_9BACT|nr:MAG: hypothetical protein A3A18_01155 [Candidatus Azambacteria bacterium RIFCSPLOWO2_01_FULL_44_84]OGD40495.1 MAG: hypothetical protein A3I30_00825 [Candidatus Azambacteria bacterium RIFCSPLOWO2_02_FULL_44_14]